MFKGAAQTDCDSGGLGMNEGERLAPQSKSVRR